MGAISAPICTWAYHSSQGRAIMYGSSCIDAPEVHVVLLPSSASAMYVSPIPSPQAIHCRSNQAVRRKKLIILIPKTSLCSLLN